MKKLAHILCVLTLVVPAVSYGHGEGADHAHDAPDLNTPAPVATGSPSLTAHGNHFDLTIAYEEFHEGERGALDVYLADWQSNLPVAGADIELNISGEKFRGDVVVVETNEPGRYRAQVEVPSAGSYSFLADVSYDGRSDLMSMSGFATTEHGHGHEGVSGGALAFGKYVPYLITGVAVIAGLIGFAFGAFVARRRDETVSEHSEEVIA